MRYLTALFSLLTATVIATTSPPSGALVVGTSSSAKYRTLQSAVTAASSGAKIFVEAGTYNEQVYIPAGKNNLIIIGSSASNDSYTSNTVTITQKLAQDSSSKPNNDNTATLRAWGDGLKVYNVNFVNTRGQGSQALALSAYGNQLGFYGCQFKGFQDTVMSQKGVHFIGKSLIVGATDFIFGQLGVLWVEGSVIEVLKANTGYVTANGRDSSTNPSYYVINNSEITGSSASGTYYLGRPWRNYARVIFQNTKMSAVINSKGWSVWQASDTRTDKVTWGEYKNTGSGASGTRSFGKTLSAAVSMSSVLGSTSWVDKAYV